MAKQVQFRRGTTAQHSTFTGAVGEVTIDTDKDVVVVHDGTTVGGFPLAKDSAKVDKVSSTDNAIVRFDGTSGAVQNSSVVIDDNGNVGIGVTPSSWIATAESRQVLQVKNASFSGTPTNVSVGSNYYRNSSYQSIYLTNANASFYIQNAGSHNWYTAPSGTAGNAITWTNAMTLDASGNLLVGTTSNTNSFKQVLNYNGGVVSGLEFQDQSGSLTRTAIRFNRNTTTQVGTITLGTSTTSYNTSSDYRLKEDYQDMVGATDRLKALKPINFAWKVDGSRVDGFLAHEVQEVVPEAATGTKDGMREEEYEVTPAVSATYDEEGNELTPAIDAVMGTRQVPDYQGIDQSKLVPLLTKALQEAVEKIEQLEARIKALEVK